MEVHDKESDGGNTPDSSSTLQETINKLEQQNAQLSSQVRILQHELGKCLTPGLHCQDDVNPDPNIVKKLKELKLQVEMTTLLNSVVLRNTFKYLGTKDLRNMRLVCSTWNSVIVTCLRNIVLNLTKLISSGDDLTILGSPNLSRSLTLDIVGKDDLFWTRVVSYFSQFHAIVENLKFKSPWAGISREPLLDPCLVFKLFELFNTFEFKNLANLSIDFAIFEDGLLQDLHSFINFHEGWKHLKLKKFEIAVTSKNTLVATPNLETTLQSFLNSFGTCLEALKIRGNFVLDLTNCRNLKFFEYSGYAYKFARPLRDLVVPHPTFEMENLNKMILSRKGSLVEISLTLNWYDIPLHFEGLHRQARDFELAMNFHKLEILTVTGLELFRSLPRLLNKARVPNLKKLVLNCNKPAVWTEFFQDLYNMNQKMDSVKEFIATDWEVDEKLLKNLAVSFPNLESLGFALCVEAIKEEEKGTRLSAIFNEVGTIWGARLKELKAVIIGGLNWTTLLSGLYTIAKIEGLKKLCIKMYLEGMDGSSWTLHDNLDDVFEDYEGGGMEAFLNFLGNTARRMESVQFINFHIGFPNAKKIFEFISEHKLPVKFMDD